DGLDRRVDVDHHALLETLRRRGADADDLCTAVRHLGHDDADLVRADVDPDRQRVLLHERLTFWAAVRPGATVARVRTMTWSSKRTLTPVMSASRPAQRANTRGRRASRGAAASHPTSNGTAGRRK